MKHIKNIFRNTLLLLLAGAALASCSEKEENIAKAVMCTESLLTYDATDASEKVVKVVSDAPWTVKHAEWLKVSPETGSATVDITVVPEDNKDGIGLLRPRQDTLRFVGIEGRVLCSVVVRQSGDPYRDAETMKVGDVVSSKESTPFYMENATVTAVTSRGFMVNDSSADIYVINGTTVKVGDVVKFKGLKSSDGGMPIVDPAEAVEITATGGKYTYPEAKDLTETVKDFKAEKIELVKVSGLVVNSMVQVSVEGVDYAFKFMDAPDAYDISKLGGNKVDVTGYAFGVRGANIIGLIVTDFVDNGPAFVPRPSELLNAKWRFTTTKLTEYASLFGGTAGITDMTEGLSDLYVPSNVKGNGKIQYYQVDKTGTTPTSGNPKRIIGGTGHPYVTGAWPGDYWLFSATDNYEYPAGTMLHIEYLTRISGTGQKYWMLEYYDGKEWQPAKEYPVKTETETGTDAKYNFVEPTSNVQVKCDWELAYPCREPKFRMRCVANWQSNGSGALANPNGGTCRIADNDDDGEDAGPLFYVTDAPDDGGSGMPSGTTVFADDFEWLEPFSNGAGAGDSVASNNPSATAPNIYSIADLEPLRNELANRGYDFFNATNKKDGSVADADWLPITETNYNVVYLQKNYLKFGKSDVSAGIKLPALTGLTVPSDVKIEFDWCWQVTGAFKADLMTLQLDALNGGSFDATGTTVSEECTSAQSTVDGESKIEWQKASVILKGATSATVIKIRPTNVNPYVSNPERGQNRFYLDNIKISVK